MRWERTDCRKWMDLEGTRACGRMDYIAKATLVLDNQEAAKGRALN